MRLFFGSSDYELGTRSGTTGCLYFLDKDLYFFFGWN